MQQNLVEITQDQLTESDRTLWLKAMSALEMNNHGYAASLILPILQNNPGFIEGRTFLRKCQAMEAGGSKKGGGKMFGISMGAKGGSPKLKKLAKSDPLATLTEVEKELKDDPYNPDLNDILHTAAASLALVKTAEFALETIHENRPGETKLLHKLAEFYIGFNQFTKASGVYQTITKHDNTDSIAVKAEKDCMAKASMLEGTKMEDGKLSLQMKDDSLRVDLEKQSRTGLTKEQLDERRDSLLHAYQENQHDIGVVTDLANVYEQLDDYASAYTFCDWAFQLSNNDSTIRAKADALKHKANQQNISTLQQALAEDPENEELKAQLHEIQSAAIEERITETSARVEENPTDALLRYELGKAYYDAGRPDEAIPHLQQAKSNPSIETKVLLLLGQTFDAKGMTDMAINQFKMANDRIIIMDGTKKEALYHLALLYEKAGNNEEYLSSLKAVYEVDYGFRDVAQRVEAAY